MSDDLIRRSDAIKAIWGDDINPSEDGMVFEAQSHIDRDIRLIPSADRPQGEPKRGVWIEAREEDPCYWKCSECKRQVDYKENFCPNCGADMRKE